MEANPAVARMMRSMFGGGDRPPVLDVMVLPKDQIYPFYEKYDAYDNDSPERLRYEFWKWIGQILPATRGKRCRLNLDIVLRPLVEVIGDFKVPTVGSKYSHVEQLTDAQIEEYLNLEEMARGARGKALPMYRLAEWVSRNWPEIAECKFGFEGSGNCGLYVVVENKESDDA